MIVFLPIVILVALFTKNGLDGPEDNYDVGYGIDEYLMKKEKGERNG